MSRTLMTIISPQVVPTVATRNSAFFSPNMMVKLPSWGRRISEMSIPAWTLILDTMLSCKVRGRTTISRSIPSTRKSTLEESDDGTM